MARSNVRSVATIDSPEFIKITSISPFISKCEIKVLYIGENRNRSFISKEVATEMAQTLPGCPIVGYYIESKEDFSDHGDQVIIDGEGIKFNTLTKPYGFVAPDTKVWFQKFDETDEFGNSCIREYLMTEGYLWTNQFKEAKRIIEEGNPQSMELDTETLKGHWATNQNTGIDFFIINDAIFSKLCILGEDVEPCFEGSTITAPQVSATFAKNDECVKTMFSMMQELKELISNFKQGGKSMEITENLNAQGKVDEEPISEFQNNIDDKMPITNFDDSGEGSDSTGTETETGTGENSSENNSSETTTEDPAPVVDDPNGTEPQSQEEVQQELEDREAELDACVNVPKKAESFEKKKDEDDEKDEEDKSDPKEKEEDEDIKKKYELLQNQYSLLEQEVKELREFKQKVENDEKDALINSFSMLSDEDKKDVIANKDKYSLKEIKAELSIICVDKKVNFSKDNDVSDEIPTTFNISGHDANNLPDWLKAVEETRKRNNNI